MKERIKELRKASSHGESQKTFADFLGISQSNLASYETGRRIPSDAVIQLICQKCNINEEWLRNGSGEMFKSKTKSQEIGYFANEIMDLPDENFKKRFISALSKLNEKDWEVLMKIVDELNKEG